MARVDVLSAMYSKRKSIRNFDFDALSHAPISFYLTPDDISRIRYFATSVKWHSKLKNEKFAEVDKILIPRGFKRFHSGTNRIVYSSIYDHSFLLKVAIDSVGMSDNPDEYYNQNRMKPFVTKVFDVTPCGTVSMVERVNPIRNRYEFEDVAGNIFDLLNEIFIGKYVMEDIGTDFLANWGIRDGFGPVLLDFPYLYELDGDKLQCTITLPNGRRCDGLIDYDNGLNTLVCEKCNQRYSARSLGKTYSEVVKSKIIEEVSEMEQEILVSIIKDGKEYKLYNESDCIAPKKQQRKRKSSEDDIVVTVTGGYVIKNEPPAEKVVETVKVETEVSTVTTTVQTATISVPAHEETEVPKPEFLQPSAEDNMNSVYMDQDPELEKNYAEETLKDQIDLEEKETQAKNSDQPTAKERTQINSFMVDQMRKFPFGDYKIANLKQRSDIVDYLVASVSSKYPIEPSLMVMIIEEFVDTQYEFEDEAAVKAEELAKNYYGGDEYEDQEPVEPINKPRVISDEF